MTTLRHALLVALFAFAARPAFAQPGAATLIAPADQAGCPSGGICTITVTPPMNAGTHVWFIRTWGAGMEGPWSPGRQFVLKDPVTNWSSKLPDARRFTVVLDDQAVLDNETGLVWLRTPGSFAGSWPNAVFWCGGEAAGGRRGWRLPALSELLSLVDITRTNPTLPSGHPFLGTSLSGLYWTQTPNTAGAGYYFYVAFNNGTFTATTGTGGSLSAWCVRGGSAGGY